MNPFKRNILSLTLSLILSLPLGALAFAGTAATGASKADFQLIHIAELKAMMTKTVAIYDANGQETRNKDGMIPGAHALSSHEGYDVKKELPATKETPLVFYCANTQCTASHAAAERAVGAGYTHVSVFADGIQGWKTAGYEVQKPATKIQ